MTTVKIEDKQLERDIKSKAVLSTNLNGLEQYKMAKKRREAELSDINTMKKDIEELKNMIQTLIGKQNG